MIHNHLGGQERIKEVGLAIVYNGVYSSRISTALSKACAPKMGAQYTIFVFRHLLLVQQSSVWPTL